MLRLKGKVRNVVIRRKYERNVSIVDRIDQSVVKWYEHGESVIEEKLVIKKVYMEE